MSYYPPEVVERYDSVRPNPFIGDIMMGMYFGYSICCISNYIRLVAAGRRPAAYMVEKCSREWLDGIGYVRCHACGKNPKPVKRREEYLSIAQKYHKAVDLSLEPPL